MNDRTHFGGVQGVPPEMSNNRAGESPAPALNETPRGVLVGGGLGVKKIYLR